MSHELRIIRVNKRELLLYCTAGDFTWRADIDDPADTGYGVDYALNQYRRHTDTRPGWHSRGISNVEPPEPPKEGSILFPSELTVVPCPNCLNPVHFKTRGIRLGDRTL